MVERSKAPWPEEGFRVINAAIEESHEAAQKAFYVVRDQLFGSADWMEVLADRWGQGKYMTDSEEAIDTARENLAGYWQGGAYDSYTAYSINAVKRISRNEGFMNEIATVMEGCIGIVYDTYADAIELLAACAHAVIEAEASFLEAVTPLGIISGVIKALNNFARAVNELIAKAVRKMGELREMGVFLARQANDFTDVKRLSDPAADPDLWAVKPKPKTPAS